MWHRLLIFAVLLIAIKFVAISGASFTHTTDTNLSVVTHTLTINSSKDAQTLFDFSSAKPGYTETTPIIITNTGTTNAIIRVGTNSLVNASTGIFTAVMLEVRKDGQLLCSQTLTALSTTPCTLETIASGVASTYDLTLNWPLANRPASAQGILASFNFRFSGANV
jgi:hypothetical protein